MSQHLGVQALLDKVQAALQAFDGRSQRAFHGRGRCYPGLEQLTVDLFSPVVLLTLFRSPDEMQPVFDLDAAQSGLKELIRGSGFEVLLVQHRYEKGSRTDCLVGELPQPCYASEHGLRYELNLAGNQNVGFFLDAEPARQWLREHAAGKRVLNLFAYTCAFSVVAVDAGAARVINMDMARNALRVGERNHRLNFTEADRQRTAKFLPYEVFRSLSRLRKQGPFDLLIADPPSFQPGSFVARSDYPRLIRKLPNLLRKDAQVLLMLNAPNLDEHFLLELCREHCPELAFQQRLQNSADFPDQDPARSVKMLVFRYL